MQRKGHHRCFARTGRGLQHGLTLRAERFDQRGQDISNGQAI